MTQRFMAPITNHTWISEKYHGLSRLTLAFQFFGYEATKQEVQDGKELEGAHVQTIMQQYLPQLSQEDILMIITFGLRTTFKNLRRLQTIPLEDHPIQEEIARITMLLEEHQDIPV